MNRTDSTSARPGSVEAGASSQSSVGGAPIFLTLPVPPSLNTAYANRRGKGARGRIHTKTAADWIREAKVAVHLQKPGCIHGPVVIVMNVERKSKSADIDNRTKLVFDLLKKQGVIDDDRFVAAFASAWSPPVKHRREDRLQIAIYPSASLFLAFQPSDATGAVGGWTIIDPADTEGTTANGY